MSEEKTETVEETKKSTLSDISNDSKKTEEEKKTEAPFGRRKKKRRRRIILNLKCPLCEAGIKDVSYKDVYQLKKFTSVRGKIISTEKSGMCHKHQNMIKRAIKRARYLALLPYVTKDK